MPASSRSVERPPSAAMAMRASMRSPSSSSSVTLSFAVLSLDAPSPFCSIATTRAGQRMTTFDCRNDVHKRSCSSACSMIHPSCFTANASASKRSSSPPAASHTRIRRYGCARASRTAVHTPSDSNSAALSGANAYTRGSASLDCHAGGSASSISVTCRPCCDNASAQAAPTTPPPTMAASTRRPVFNRRLMQ